jgi:prevent-host-death family protein
MLDACLKRGPQMITRRGADAAVLVPADQWQRISSQARPTLKDLLLSDEARGELNIPPRGERRRRPPHQIG